MEKVTSIQNVECKNITETDKEYRITCYDKHCNETVITISGDSSFRYTAIILPEGLEINLIKYGNNMFHKKQYVNDILEIIESLKPKERFKI